MLIRACLVGLVAAGHHHDHDHPPQALPRHGLGQLEEFIKNLRKEYSQPMKILTDEELKREERIAETESYIIN